jgi:hypothetical protein
MIDFMMNSRISKNHSLGESQGRGPDGFINQKNTKYEKKRQIPMNETQLNLFYLFWMVIETSGCVTFHLKLTHK